MAGKRPRLTPQLIKDLCERIKAGAFEHVAAESLGIPFSVYQRWLSRGQGDNAGRTLRAFCQAVQQAKAHARFMAEMDMRAKNSKWWLLHGPGKQADGLPGWTLPVKSQPDPDKQPLNPLLHPEIVQLLNALCQALAPFPEAHAAVAQVLNRAGDPQAQSDSK